MLNVIMLSVVMLHVIMLSVVMLNVIMLSVVMLNVVAPQKQIILKMVPNLLRKVICLAISPMGFHRS